MRIVNDYSFLFKNMPGTAKPKNAAKSKPVNLFNQIKLSDINGKSAQEQLKAAGIDTGGKQYQAVMNMMFASVKGGAVAYTNPQAIKNLFYNLLYNSSKQGKIANDQLSKWKFYSEFKNITGQDIRSFKQKENGFVNEKGESASDIYREAPWTDGVPELSVYDQRGCRMLDARTWKSKCFTCKWANMANVAIEYDWGVSQRFRFETFCYGPKNCIFYKMGKPRAVPYKGDDSSYDDGCLDEILTDGRDDDE